MRVLVACEQSGTVRDAFRALGHDAWSCDIEPDHTGSVYHHQGDVRHCIGARCQWDLMIAHPPCTYLASAGLHWNNRIPERREKTWAALDFVRLLLAAPIPRIALENPVGAISTHIRKSDQIIQPWQFGHDASKQTALWLKGLPALVPTNILTPTRFQANGRPRWGNMTPTGQNNLGPSADRAITRAITYQGIADAMAAQWGTL